MRGLVWAITETNANESGQSRGGAPALAASADLPAHAHHDDVDRASHHGSFACHGLRPTRLVADRTRRRPAAILACRILLREHPGPPAPIPVQLGAHPPYA